MNKTFLTLLAGVAIGLLVAPSKGSETWKRVVGSFDKLKGEVSDELDDMYGTAKDELAQGKSRVDGKAREWPASPVS